MKNLLLVMILVSSIFGGCSNPANKKSEVEEGQTAFKPKTDFEKYISTLDQISLPLDHNPLGLLPDISKNYDKTGFEKFKHTWTSKPLGIYYKDEKTVGIIDCSIGDYGLVPFLTTYDFNGNKIDSTGFYDKSGQDIAYYAIEYVTFNKDKTISVVDTVKHWDLNEEESDRIEGSMKFTTGETEYMILSSGQINKK